MVFHRPKAPSKTSISANCINLFKDGGLTMWTFIQYELSHWIRRPMLWIFFGVITLVVALAASSEFVTIGTATAETVNTNAPKAIQAIYATISIITLLMITAFLNSTANRDISSGMSALVFSSPIKKRDYFFGKFIGAITISFLPVLGVSLGMLIAPLLPWANTDRFGDINWIGHLEAYLVFGLANTLMLGVIIYGLAITFRSVIVSFVGAMVILVVVSIGSVMATNLDHEWLAALIDPFGMQALDMVSKFMTIEEQNTITAPLAGWLLWNRLLWFGVAGLIMAILYFRFSFTPKEGKARKKVTTALAEEQEAIASFEIIKTFSEPASGVFSWAAFRQMTWFQTRSIIRNTTFLIIIIIGLINMLGSLILFSDMYGTSVYPTSYAVVDRVWGSFSMFMIAIIIFYTGALLWKERDAKINDIVDASAVPTASVLLSKFVAMMIALAMVQLVVIGVGVLTQLAYGYPQIDIQVYVVELLISDMLRYAHYTVAALLIHSLVNNRYIGYFAFVAMLIANMVIPQALRSEFNMFLLWSRPTATFSDMNGYGPFIPGMVWFNLYWVLFSALLMLGVYAFFVRGQQQNLKFRLAEARARIFTARVPAAALLFGFILMAGIIYYNTAVLNTYQSSKQAELIQRDYELTYKHFEGIPQPRWVSFAYEIDIFPNERDLFVKTNAKIVNKTDAAIDSLHFTMPFAVNPEDVIINIKGASLLLDDSRLAYRIYLLDDPMQPGDTLDVNVQTSIVTRGFENEVSFTSLNPNGTFFNNWNIMPFMGYLAMAEIVSPSRRSRLGLPERQRMPRLDENDMASRGNQYISADSDWVSMRSVISTATDQIAVAPGSLIREWTDGDRRYFEYELDHPSLNFYSFISARYEVARERWNDVDLEVYYVARHAMNVPNMLASLRHSLEYFTENFGPYHHRQARIIEFPRYARFAQAFPGTMPYSEGIGFVSDLRNLQPGDIDPVFYVVAHEMAHQYWAHQLVGARMQGAEMLSEAFAQYSALMVMEQAYGRDQMHTFLRHEMNGYLRGRGSERQAERPLMEVEEQGYIFYNKGTIAMYYLKEMIGEDKVNKALVSLLEQYAYREPPYATSMSAVRAFRQVTPDSLQYVIDDLFETITLFSNRVVNATYEKDGDEYVVTLTTLSEKFRADSLGVQTPVPLNDYIDIGIFARPVNGLRLGEPLHYERVYITQAENTFVRRVSAQPRDAGIDPYNYLIDRQPETNVRRVNAK
ncbi:MAG: hypothetical protein EA361_13245 [Bacteroidetes bacterium]|nr:MAG: hypothetical protein EA361_13245 [Bacteroidota bacterium]